MVAIVAAQHNIPFFVAAPTTTLDPQLDSGSQVTGGSKVPRQQVNKCRAVQGVEAAYPISNNQK